MKVVTYTRYSSDNQREESIEAQDRAIELYCKDKGYEIVGKYVDMALTATNDDRPEFQRMIRDSGKGLFNGVVVHKLDRFARNRYDSAIYGRKLQQNSVKVISVLENLDDSPESVILRSVIEGYNEYYSLNLARETMKGLKENAYTARHNGGLPPYGYNVGPDNTYIINEKEAEAVRIAFKLYLEGHGYGEISDTLNKLGYKTKTGKPFGKSGLYDILGNEKYTGVYIYNKRASTVKGVKQNRKHKDPDEIIRIDGGMPAIISKKDFDKIRVQREKNKRAAGRFSSVEPYLLSGLVICGKCGGAMTGARSYSGRSKILRVVYECSRRKRDKSCDAKAIRKDLLENYVFEAMKKDIFDRKDEASFLEQVQAKLDVGREDNLRQLNHMKAKLEDNLKQSTKIVEAITAGMDPVFFMAKSKKLISEKEDLLRNISMKEYDIIENRMRVEDVTKQLNKSDLNGDKEILFKTWIKSVKVNEETIEVIYRYELV